MGKNEIVAKSVDHLLSILESKSNSSFIFRGVRSSEHSLVPGFFRGLNDNLKNNDIVVKFNHQHNEFVNFLKSSKYGKKYLYEYYFTGQHYGFMTKLLDFSKSYKVALAFAVYDRLYENKNEGYVGIYIVDTKKTGTINANNNNEYNSLLLKDNSITKFIDHIYIEPNTRSKRDVRKRISKQKGCFIYFKGFSNKGYNLLEYEFIKIPNRLVPNIKERLRDV